jgi:hypothetical protein
MRAGKADKTKGYWETFIGKCFDFRLDNFASKPTKANIGELQLMNHLHFGSGAGQDRLTRCVLFFTVDAPKSYKGDTTVRIGQNQAGKMFQIRGVCEALECPLSKWTRLGG